MTSDRPFVDRPVGDLAVAEAAATELALVLKLAPPVLLRSGMNALYRSGEAVIRVGRPSADPHASLELAATLTGLGIRVPQPVADTVVSHASGVAATAWHAIEAVDTPIDWTAVGAVIRGVHAIAADVIPASYPVPSPASFPWWDFDALLADVGGDIDAAAREGLSVAIDAGRGWDRFSADQALVCHGDVHPGNVMMSAEGPVLLDWDLLCCAPPAWDHAMLLTLATRWGGDPEVYQAFAEGYGLSLADDPVAQRLAQLRNVAATLMRVRAGRTDPAAAAEAERRLRFWRGDPDAPVWQAQ